MTQIVLKIDALNTTDIFGSADREAMLEVSRNLLGLSWSYRPGSGGLWSGEAQFYCAENSRAWRQLKRGRHGAAWIYREPPSGRDMATFDANEENRLLWFGTLENVRLDPEAEIVTCELRGAGQILENTVIDLLDVSGGSGGTEFAWQLATNAANLAATQGPFPSKFIATVGACGRKVYLDEEDISVAEAFRKIADQIGGEGVIAWGVRPAGGADDRGEIYFQPWASSLWERSAGFLVDSWPISRRRLLAVEVGRDTRDLKNDVSVFLTEDEFKRFAGRAQAQGSINRFGRRRLNVVDRNVKTSGQAMAVAAGVLEERASPKLNLAASFTDSLDPGEQGAHPDGAEAGLVQTAFQQGARPVTLLLEQETPPAVVGEDVFIAELREESTRGNLLAVDTSNAGLTMGRYHPNPTCNSTAGLALNESLLYVIQGRFAGTNPSGNINLWELDRKLCIALGHMGGDNYQVALNQHQTSGGWTTIALGGVNIPFTLGAAGTNLDEKHTFGIEIRDTGGAGVNTCNVYFIDANGTRTTVGAFFGSVTPANYSGNGTNDWILVNGAVGTGSANVANKTWSRDYNLLAFDVYTGAAGTASASDYNGRTPGELLDLVANDGPAFEAAACRILSIQPSIVSLGTGPLSADQCAVRYAFSSTYPGHDHEWGIDALIATDGSSSFTTSTDFDVYSNVWMLGGGSRKRLLGSGIEILPREVRCTYQGPNDDLLIELQGDAPATSIVGSVEKLRRDLDTLQRETE